MAALSRGCKPRIDEYLWRAANSTFLSYVIVVSFSLPTTHNISVQTNSYLFGHALAERSKSKYCPKLPKYNTHPAFAWNWNKDSRRMVNSLWQSNQRQVSVRHSNVRTTTSTRFDWLDLTLRAKKVVSDSPGLVDFAIGLVNSVINLPDGQVNFFEEFKLQKNFEINLLIKTFLGLVEMIFELVNVSFSLPEWQAVTMTFFAPCDLKFFHVFSKDRLLESFTYQFIALLSLVKEVTRSPNRKIIKLLTFDILFSTPRHSRENS